MERLASWWINSHKSLVLHILPPSYGYPFALISQVIYSLDATTGLSVEIISQNIGDKPAPYGVGVHPYLTCDLAPVDDYTLQLPAKEVLLSIHSLTHQRYYASMSWIWTIPSNKKIGDKRIDHTFKTYSERWEAKIINHQQELAVSLCSDQPWLQVYSGEKLNRRGLAIEPMSCPPNAFNSGIDLLLLKPKQQHILF